MARWETHHDDAEREYAYDRASQFDRVSRRRKFPAVDAGPASPSVQYGFLRPNGGEILTGELKSAFPSAWSGMLRGGVRMSINTVLLEASAGYLSFGQPDLDVWEGKLRLSVGF